MDMGRVMVMPTPTAEPFIAAMIGLLHYFSLTPTLVYGKILTLFGFGWGVKDAK